MAQYLAPGSRPTTNTDSDFDGYGTPQASSPFIPPAPLGASGPMPSAYSLASATTPRESGYNNYHSYADRGDGGATPNNNSAPLLPHEGEQHAYNKEGGGYLAGGAARRPLYKRPWFYFLLAAAAVVIALAVALPVVFVGRHHNSSSATASGASSGGNGGGGSSGNNGGGGGSGGGGGGGKGGNLATFGGDGSTVTKADGSTFTYHNSFGGFCECALWYPARMITQLTLHSLGVSDPSNPFNNSAKPNSWTPAIGEKWTWGQDHIYGYVRLSLIPAYTG